MTDIDSSQINFLKFYPFYKTNEKAYVLLKYFKL